MWVLQVWGACVRPTLCAYLLGMLIIQAQKTRGVLNTLRRVQMTGASDTGDSESGRPIQVWRESQAGWGHVKRATLIWDLHLAPIPAP